MNVDIARLPLERYEPEANANPGDVTLSCPGCGGRGYIEDRDWWSDHQCGVCLTQGRVVVLCDCGRGIVHNARNRDTGRCQ